MTYSVQWPCRCDAIANSLLRHFLSVESEVVCTHMDNLLVTRSSHPRSKTDVLPNQWSWQRTGVPIKLIVFNLEHLQHAAGPVRSLAEAQAFQLSGFAAFRPHRVGFANGLCWPGYLTTDQCSLRYHHRRTARKDLGYCASARQKAAAVSGDPCAGRAFA